MSERQGSEGEGKWARLDGETLVSTRWYDFCHDRYRLPAGGEGDYYYIHIAGSTMIVPERPDGRLALVRQHRYLFGRRSLEFPAGGIKRGSDPERCAREELEEEAGYRAARWERLGAYAPCNGLSDELCTVFLARELTAVAAAPEPTEELEPVALTLEEVQDRVASGEIWDGMSIIALRLYEGWLARER